MKLIKPLSFFDLETTGTQVDQDRIVSIHVLKIHPDGHQETKNSLINPGIQIPQGATDIHGITDEKVSAAPTFKQLSKALFDFLLGSDLAGYNSNKFDIPLLIMEFHRCEIEFPTHDPVIFDGYLIEKRVNSHKLSEVFKRYTGIDLDGAHNAEADVEGTNTVVEHQMDVIRQRFPDVLNEDGTITPEILERFGNDGKTRFDYSGKCHIDGNGNVCWSFGKNRDNPVMNDRSYLNWVLNANFPGETKTKLKNLLIEKSKENDKAN